MLIDLLTLSIQLHSKTMTKLITQAVFNGTKQNLAIAGANANAVMTKIRKKKELRTASCFIFFDLKTGLMKDVRMN